MLCYSQDETRKKAVETREKEQAFVQSDPRDVISKGSEFPKRFDTYFDYADEIFFYWNNELAHGKLPAPCAKFVKNGSEPTLTVLNEVDWNNFCSKYLKDIQQYNIKICNSFVSLIPKELLVVPKESFTLSAHALPQAGLYGTNSSPSLNVVHGASPSNDSSESKTLYQAKK